MSAETLPPPVAPPAAGAPPVAGLSTVSLSPNQRAWARFRRNKLGFVSLIVFTVMLVVRTLAELVSNDRPLVASYDGKLYFPLFHNQPEKVFGGDFLTATEWNDPLIRAHFAKPG